MLKAPIAVNPSIVVNKHGGVETIDTSNLIRVIVFPVAHPKWTIRTIALCYQTIAIASLVVGEKVICLLAITVGYQCYIRSIQHIGSLSRVEWLALGILVYHKDYSIVAPVVQILDRSRPNYLVATAICSLQVVVRTIYIYALLAWVVRIIEHIRFAVGYMLPQGQIWVAYGGKLIACRFWLMCARCCHCKAACSSDSRTQHFLVHLLCNC